MIVWKNVITNHTITYPFAASSLQLPTHFEKKNISPKTSLHWVSIAKLLLPAMPLNNYTNYHFASFRKILLQ